MYDLQTIEAIKRLKYMYMRCLDQKLWDEMAECFVEDATAAYSGGKYSFQGRDALLAFLKDSMGSPKVLSSHRVHHPEIDITSETTATGRWGLEDVFINEEMGVTVRGAAYYEDEYVKVGDTWKIKHTGYERAYEEMESRNDMTWLTITQRFGQAD